MLTGIFFRQSPKFDDVYRHSLIAAIQASEFFGPSVLGKEFVNTAGLSLVFRRTHLGVVTSHFPCLGPLFAAALFDTSNAFYVNPLILDDRSIVEEHIDCRYIPATGGRILPTLVSVYYAEIDDRMDGGALIFVTDDGSFAVPPRCNEIVHFIGSTRHYVSRICNPCRRVSIVIEQYNLGPESLAAFPDCHVVRDQADGVAPSRN
ncbi:MAG: hypothetical protein JSS55_15920 [Proteobacteria bacterium]|nr:hypothetical protein [Pseudomonadota bacterium]